MTESGSRVRRENGMFDRRLLVTGVAIVTVVMTAVVATRFPKQASVVPLLEHVSGVPVEESQQAPPQPAYQYLIKEYQGRVAVYNSGSQEPDMVLDVLVKYLPDYDRQQMQQGIPVNSYNELVSLIEDYTS